MQIKLRLAFIILLHSVLIQISGLSNRVWAQEYSQGDMLIVSVNTGDESAVDLIPLQSIQASSELVLSNKSWDDELQAFVDGPGDLFSFEVDRDLAAGEVFRINLPFKLNDAQDHLYLVAKEGTEGYQLVYGAFWDSKPNKLFRKRTAELIPESLIESEAFIQLATKGNHQYAVRNGASGTASMLQAFVKDPAHWETREQAFIRFGTGFTLLSPPVVQFDVVRSSVEERSKKIAVNVAVYEHDGSELKVAVQFRPESSTLSVDEFTSRTKMWFSFEGLVGDAVFEAEFKINDDPLFEHTELAVFSLDSLSKGSIGDFRLHNAFVRDNDTPLARIISLVHSPEEQGVGDSNFDGKLDKDDDQFLIIQNLEQIALNLKDWRITNPKTRHIFETDIILKPNETITVFGGGKPDSSLFSIRKVEISNKGGLKLDSNGGKVRIIDALGQVVDTFEYSRLSDDDSNAQLIAGNLSFTPSQSSQAEVAQAIVTAKQEDGPSYVDLKLPKTEGWHFLPSSSYEMLMGMNFEMNPYIWNKELGDYELIQSLDAIKYPLILTFINEDYAAELSEFQMLSEEYEENPIIEWEIETLDFNEDSLITGSEGIIPLANPTLNEIPVSYFKSSLERLFIDDLEGAQVYLLNPVGDNKSNFVRLELTDSIPPKSPFWLKVNNILPQRILSIDLNQIQEEVILIDGFTEEEEVDVINEGFFTLGISNDEIQDDINIRFSSADSIEMYPDLNGYYAFKVFDEGVDLIGKYQDMFLSNIEISNEFEEPIEIPLHLYLDQAYELNFTVDKWEELPFGVRIQLVDNSTGLVEELEKGWEQPVIIEISEDLFSYEPGLELYYPMNTKTDYNRYSLRILPEGYEENTDESLIPESLELYQNFPNPFNPTTTISFYLPEADQVKLSIYNVVGQPVATLINSDLPAGEHRTEWNASNLPSGIYIYQLEVGNKVMTRKMTLVK